MNRRSFLGALSAAFSAAAIAPNNIINNILKQNKPKKIFSFYTPNKIYNEFSFLNLRKELGKRTYPNSKPTIILVSQEQFDFTINKLKEMQGQYWLDTGTAQAGYLNCKFNGLTMMSKNPERPNGFWKEDIEKYPHLKNQLMNPLDVTNILGRPEWKPPVECVDKSFMDPEWSESSRTLDS